MEAALLLDELGDLPQAFNGEQGQFSGTAVSRGDARIIRQAGRNGSMIAIRHANDEVGIWPSANANELHTLTIQRMMRMGHGDPIHRWLVKEGSVL